MRFRPAPRAARTENSRRRAELRPSSRLARFAHAISSTKLTAAIRNITAALALASAMPNCCRDITVVPQPLLVSGCVPAMRCAIVSISDAACFCPKPGLSRPKTRRNRELRPVGAISSRENASGIQISASKSHRRKLPGITPMMAYGLPLIRITRPSTRESLSNFFLHSSSLRTTT